MLDQENLLNIQYTILGTLLREPEHVGEAMEKLQASDFDGLATRGLFDAISKLHFAGAPIDPVTVRKEAGEDYDAAIQEVMGYHTTDILYYCDTLQEFSRLKKIQDLAYTLAIAPSLEAADGVLSRINGLTISRQKLDICSAHDMAKDFLARHDQTEKPEYIRFGMEELDKHLYVRPGDFVVVGGYPSAGKTLLSIQFALSIAARYRVGYFSLETGRETFEDRILAHMAKIPLPNIKENNLNDAEWAAVAEAAVRLSKMPFDLISAAGMTVRDIQAVTLSRRYQVIFVDYLQLVSDGGKNRYEEVTNISKNLHILAQKQNVTVVALAQLARPDKSTGKPQPPSMTSFRESGQIEQDADVALLLWPVDLHDNRSNRNLKIGKNKEGTREQIQLAFSGITQTLTPLPEPVMQQMTDAGRKAKQMARAAAAPEYVQTGFVDITNRPGLDLPF